MEVEELQTPSPIDLPQHLITSEILVRLPIKSLVRFKSVSKEWKSVISSPLFSRFHLHFRRSFPHYSPKLLFALPVPNPTDRPLSVRYKSFWVFDSEVYNRGANPLREIDTFRERAHIWGCSDGLLLLSSFVLFHIWNPATKVSRNIVHPTLFKERRWLMVGFGYVSSIEDYKIVSLCVQHLCDTDEYQAQAFTLCLKAGTWKRLGFNVPDLRSCYNSRAGVLVNETTYWLLRNSLRELRVVGFDLASDRFTELEPPEWMGGHDKGQLLSKIQGCLCFCSFKRHTGRVDLSLLKETGGSTSWVKYYGFDNVVDVVSFSMPFRCLNVSGVWPGKFIIYSNTESAVLIGVNDKNPPDTEILMTSRRDFRSPDHVEYYYEESLASPFGDLGESSKEVGKVKI